MSGALIGSNVLKKNVWISCNVMEWARANGRTSQVTDFEAHDKAQPSIVCESIVSCCRQVIKHCAACRASLSSMSTAPLDDDQSEHCCWCYLYCLKLLSEWLPRYRLCYCSTLAGQSSLF